MASISPDYISILRLRRIFAEVVSLPRHSHNQSLTIQGFAKAARKVTAEITAKSSCALLPQFVTDLHAQFHVKPTKRRSVDSTAAAPQKAKTLSVHPSPANLSSSLSQSVAHELEAAESKDNSSPLTKAKAARVFEQLDVNKDGVVDRAEFARAFRKLASDALAEAPTLQQAENEKPPPQQAESQKPPHKYTPQQRTTQRPKIRSPRQATTQGQAAGFGLAELVPPARTSSSSPATSSREQHVKMNFLWRLNEARAKAGLPTRDYDLEREHI